MDPSFLQELFRDSRKLRKGTDTTAYEAFMGFYHAVTWRDPGVIGLLAFHAVYALACLLVCRHPTVHIGMFLLTCALSYSATYLNTFLAAHWRDFGFSQNYFDKHGVFMSSLFCAPLLLVAFSQMVSEEWGGALGRKGSASCSPCAHQFHFLPPPHTPRSSSPCLCPATCWSR